MSCRMNDTFRAAPKCGRAGHRGLDGGAGRDRRSCGHGKPDIASAGVPMELPRLAVVFCFWQCDKKNHGWCEGPPVTGLCQSFRSAGRAFTLRHNQSRTKKEYSFPRLAASPQSEHWPVIFGYSERGRPDPAGYDDSSVAFGARLRNITLVSCERKRAVFPSS
jgi:hypothetical protein